MTEFLARVFVIKIIKSEVNKLINKYINLVNRLSMIGVPIEEAKYITEKTLREMEEMRQELLEADWSSC